MDPVLHLSIPVVDLVEAREFYVGVLGCDLGRVRDGWLDVWFHGLQLTLQERPDEVLPEDRQGVRHFGVTLDADALRAVLARLDRASVRWASPPDADADADADAEADGDGKTSAKVRDPSGNVSEFKAYDDLARLERVTRDADLSDT